jgi:hypothetical protein
MREHDFLVSTYDWAEREKMIINGLRRLTSDDQNRHTLQVQRQRSNVQRSLALVMSSKSFHNSLQSYKAGDYHEALVHSNEVLSYDSLSGHRFHLLA